MTFKKSFVIMLEFFKGEILVEYYNKKQKICQEIFSLDIFTSLILVHYPVQQLIKQFIPIFVS